MGILDYLEYSLGYVLSSFKGRDAGLFSKSSLITSHPTPSLTVTSPDLGPSGSSLAIEHSGASIGGSDHFPSLKWTLPTGSMAAEYALIAEDPDAPISIPALHGFYYAIPSTCTSISHTDFHHVEGTENTLSGGFKFGRNRRGTVYGGARPPYAHGPHRYFFTVVALNQKLDQSKLGKESTLDDLKRECHGKVVGWGEWIGVFERKWS